MPPVFGPVSPSPTRLWSCAAAERQRGLAVAQREQRDFLADQAFLDHHRVAGVAECAGLHHRVDRCERCVLGRGNHDALAGGEAVRLHHDGRATPTNELARGVGIIEAFPLRGGDAGGVAQLLGEGLAAFELCRGVGRPNAGDRRPPPSHR